MSLRHFLRFNVASLAGVFVQLATLWVLIHVCSLHYLLATVVAVAVAVAHNFVWHVRWTWADRQFAPSDAVRAFWRFAAANGAVSLAGNVLMMPLLVGWLDVAPLPANLVAIASSGLLNFWLADQVAFRTQEGRGGRGSLGWRGGLARGARKSSPLRAPREGDERYGDTGRCCQHDDRLRPRGRRGAARDGRPT